MTALCENDIKIFWRHANPVVTRIKAVGAFILKCQRFPNFYQMKNDFLSFQFLCFLKTIIAILITKVDEKEVGIIWIYSAFKWNLVQIHSNSGDRHLCLGKLKCHTNKLQKNQKLKWISALYKHITMKVIPTSLASYFLASHPSNFQFLLCLSFQAWTLSLSCIFGILNPSSWQQPHLLQLDFYA